jgi:fimbrial chaperone protein
MITQKRIALGVIGLVLTGSAAAANFSVSPLRLDLTSRSAMLVVTHEGDTPVDLEVKAKIWTQVDGKDVYGDTSTSDLEVSPQLFTLPTPKIGKKVCLPNKCNIKVSVVNEGIRSGTEKAYRLYVTELPPPHHEAGESVVIRTSFGIPVFVSDPNAKVSAKLRVSVEGGGGGFIKVRLVNQGTAHAHLKSITSDPAGITSGEMDEWYVLPGASHLYSLPISGSVCGQSQALLSIHLDQGKPIAVPVSIPGGACKSG